MVVLRQAVLNLLDNAIKYSASGGEIRIVLRTRPEGKAVLEVIDRGPGIGVDSDIDGQSRPMGAGFDLGADEALFVFLPLIMR